MQSIGDENTTEDKMGSNPRYAMQEKNVIQKKN